MDYNTDRPQLRLPEYGRNVQNMVDYALTIKNRAERQACANTIVSVMAHMLPKEKRNGDFLQTLWDHLAYLSNYQLDIDWPCEINRVDETEKPEQLPYPQSNIPLRHYGKLISKLVDTLSQMVEGEEREELLQLVANQMRKELFFQNRTSMAEKHVVDDLAYLSKGKIQIDESQLTFHPINMIAQRNATNRSKKKK